MLMLQQWFSLLVSFFTPMHILTKPVKGPATANRQCPAALNFTLRALGSDQEVNLCQAYLGKVLLIVNTASKCGFTPQLEGLEKLYKTYQERGFVVLGFPSNDFANQEPGNEQEIQNFCRLTYGVQFPMFEKTQVTKANASPIYQVLGEMASEYPVWNFHKYLLNTKGELIGSFSSFVKPQNEKLVKLIEANLPQ